ncbi:MAG: DUF1398 domain-containing protein [Terriglobia bacterium]
MGGTMNTSVIEECIRLSFADKLTFPEVVKRLVAIGVERYHADLSRLQNTYYNLSGETAQYPLPLDNPPAIHEQFSASEVAEALRAIQGGKIDYGEFLRRIMKAGAASYDVFMGGRKAIYTGRRGDFYVENFPGSK